mmetsp:Transcript_44103/g.141401  ORF Transcript_44103/g.141401 Transcript_44103/m.141401 type:complete len:223 (-) Transcript_44103:149-817(-)
MFIDEALSRAFSNMSICLPKRTVDVAGGSLIMATSCTTMVFCPGALPPALALSAVVAPLINAVAPATTAKAAAIMDSGPIAATAANSAPSKPTPAAVAAELNDSPSFPAASASSSARPGRPARRGAVEGESARAPRSSSRTGVEDCPDGANAAVARPPWCNRSLERLGACAANDFDRAAQFIKKQQPKHAANARAVRRPEADGPPRRRRRRRPPTTSGIAGL